MTKLLTIISACFILNGIDAVFSSSQAAHETPSVTGYAYCVPPSIHGSVLLGSCDSLKVSGTTFHDGACYTGMVENPTQYYMRIDAGPEGFHNTLQSQVSNSPLSCPLKN